MLGIASAGLLGWQCGDSAGMRGNSIMIIMNNRIHNGDWSSHVNGQVHSTNHYVSILETALRAQGGVDEIKVSPVFAQTSVGALK